MSNEHCSNMTLWDSISKTDPRHTKQVAFGRKFTAIDAHYQIREATRAFGPVGKGWGYGCEHGTIDVGDSTVLAWCDVYLWWYEVNGAITNKHEYGPVRGMSELHWRDKNGKMKFDTDAPKKAMTDAITKGLSHLGFSADVFLGLFDDNKYMAERRQEIAAEEKDLGDQAWLGQVILKMIDKAQSVEDLEAMRSKIADKLNLMSKENQEFFNREYKSIEEKLNGSTA